MKIIIKLRLTAGLLTWVNIRNVRTAMKIQDAFTFAKLVALVVIIVAGAYHLARGNVDNYARPFDGTHWRLSSLATATYQGFFSFAGW